LTVFSHFTSVGSARKNRPALRCGNFGLAGGVAEVSAFHRIIGIKTLFVILKVLFLAKKRFLMWLPLLQEILR
jgi:hypothetical protein